MVCLCPLFYPRNVLKELRYHNAIGLKNRSGPSPHGKCGQTATPAADPQIYASLRVGRL